MHPAHSIIAFTTASGAGYGLLFLLALAGALGLVPPARWLGFVGLGLALGLITAGLLASLLHLGRPERAWRALSQWRSSWLSREGVAAIATYVPASIFAIAWVFFETTGGIAALFGLLAALGAAITVYATSMIYASLRPIRQWHQPLVPPVYLAMALASGALWLTPLLAAFGLAHAVAALLALAALALAWGAKTLYWRRIAEAPPQATAGSALGLGKNTAVRLVEPPHTEENYLQREMAFVVARRHADKLRRLAILLGLAIPTILLLVTLALRPGLAAALAALLAAVSGMAGIAIERWLFFAEARHTVTLYYGAEAA